MDAERTGLLETLTPKIRFRKQAGMKYVPPVGDPQNLWTVSSGEWPGTIRRCVLELRSWL